MKILSLLSPMQSIHSRLLILQVGLIFCLIFAAAVLQIHREKSLIKSQLSTVSDLHKLELEHEGALFSRNLKIQIEEGIASYNLSFVEQIISGTIQENENVTYAILMDKDAAPLFNSLKQIPEFATKDASFSQIALRPSVLKQNYSTQQTSFQDKDYLEFITWLQVGTSDWGVIRLGFSLEAMHTALTKMEQDANQEINTLLLQISIGATLFLLFSIILVNRLAKHISKPLQNLTREAEKLAHGDFHIELLDLHNSKDEIGVLARTFKTMAANLIESHQKLAQYNQNLEKQVSQRTNQLQQAMLELEKQASTDQLTGAYNRRKFELLFATEVDRIQRYLDPLSLIIFDIDHFKNVNDNYGHHVGDLVLIDIAKLIQDCIRGTDNLIRWGGEEFVVLAIHTSQANIMILAEKLRSIVAAHPFPEVGKITISLGVSEYIKGDSLETVMQRADAALYRAKEGGRNKVEAAY